MNYSARPTINELMSSLNVSRWPQRWNEIYDDVMIDYEKNGCRLTDPSFYDGIAAKYNVIGEFLDTYKSVAREISTDDLLSRFLSLIAASMRDRKNAKADINSLDLPKSADGRHVDKYTMLPALAMCETVDYTYSLIKDRGLPEEQVSYVMNHCDGANMVRKYQKQNNGKLGAVNWSWYQLGVDAKLYTSELLSFELGKEFVSRATVFENNDGELVTAAHSEIFDKDGYILGTFGHEDSTKAFEPTITELDDEWRAYLYDERGLAQNIPTTLKKSEWRIKIAPGDPVIALHIPAGKPLAPSLVSQSLDEIRSILARYFPEVEYKAFVCGSWLLSPTLEDILNLSSNIVAFGKRFKRIAHKGEGTSVFSFVFLQNDVNSVNLDTLPENTSLERALKKHYLDGGRVYDTYGYILK